MVVVYKLLNIGVGGGQPSVVGRVSRGFSAVHCADLPATLRYMAGGHFSL